MIRLEPMTDADYPAFEARCKQDYAAEVSQANDLSPAVAMEQAEATFRRLLPDGRPGQPDQHLMNAVDDAGEHVGSVWFGIRRDRPQPYAYIWDLYLAPAHRGKGYGEAIMRLIEATVRELGYTRISLNVFGHNVPARRLYEKLGFRAAAISMDKHL